jgi:DNA-binding transcriptional LysR family regulator
VSLFPANVQELRRYWETFRSRHPQWELRLRVSAYRDPFAQLRNGEVDVLVTWLPVEEPDLTVGPLLFAEPRVLAVAGGHALTRWSSVSLEAVSDFQHLAVESAPGYWYDRYVPKFTPKGRLIDRTANANNIEEVFMHTVLDETVALFPVHVSRYFPRPDIAYLPVTDMDALSYGLVWLSAAENDLIRAFARVARDLGPLPG